MLNNQTLRVLIFWFFRTPRASVTVPVMKPSVLPNSLKTPAVRQTIYTSPTAKSGEDRHNPELVPIVQRTPTVHAQPVKSEGFQLLLFHYLISHFSSLFSVILFLNFLRGWTFVFSIKVLFCFSIVW